MQLYAFLFIVFASAHALVANEIYSTDFDSFTVGTNNWAGQDGWVGTSTNTGSHGVDSGQISGFGNTAFLGFAQPDRSFVTLLRPSPISPTADRVDTVSLRTQVGVRDSQNGRRDSFHLLVFNQSGETLAGIQLDNRDTSYGIWRIDDGARTDTGVNFLRSELHDIRFDISFSNNTWTAYLDGVPLFQNLPFHSGSKTLDLAGFGIGWQIHGGNPAQFGDNWLLVANWRVSSTQPLRENLELAFSPTAPRLSSVARASGTFTLEEATSPSATWVASSPAMTLQAKAGVRIDLPLPSFTATQKFYRLHRVSP